MYKIKLYCYEVCVYCERAKNLLNSLELEYEVEVVKREQMSELYEKTGMMTVPQIFINDKLIGGFTELEALYKKGELNKLVFDDKE